MVYVFLADGFETIEALAAADVLRRGGVETLTVGVAGRTAVSSHGIPVACDILMTELLPETPEMLVLPGGGAGVENLRACEGLRALLKNAFAQNIPVGAICAAPSILAELNLLRGRRVTCHPSVEAEVLAGGAALEPRAAVRDERLVTGRGAGVCVDFALELLALLRGEGEADRVAGAMIFDRRK